MDLARARELINGLADGINPLTGELLPDDCVCNQADIVRAFHTILAEPKKKDSKPQPENAGKPWTENDEQTLCQMFDAGNTKKELCTYFKRSQGAIAARLVRMGKIQDRDEFREKSR